MEYKNNDCYAVDIEVSMRKIEAAGGKPQTEKMDVPGVEKLRYYKDTEGNIYGIIEPSTRL